MMMHTPVDKRLIFAYFANTTSPLQKRLIEEWLRNEANQELFYAWLVEWEHQHPCYVPELDRPLERLRAHMATQSVPVAVDIEDEPSPQRWVGVGYRWLAAASVVMACGLGLWLTRDKLLYETYQTGYGQTQTLRLTDGSTVVLNANSALRLSRFGFARGSRDVHLRGEAFFSVAHRPDNQRFVVHTQRSFAVEVHGTEFTVSTFAHRARVMLRTGKVLINYGPNSAQKQLILRPGDLVTLDQPARPVVQHRVEPHPYLAFTEHRFAFDNMTLKAFGQLLTDTYGLEVEIPDPAVARRTLAGSFSAQNADELLDTIAELFDLTVTREGNSVQLTQRE